MGNGATTANVLLGIFNAYMLLRSRIVMLRVVPIIPMDGPAIAENPDTYEIRVQVVNLSSIPVYVDEIGLKHRNRVEGVLKFRAPPNRPYPILLNAREAIYVQPAPDDFMRVVADRFSCGYARTACGRRRRGTSPALQTQELLLLESQGASRLARTGLRLRHAGQRIAGQVAAVFG
ncbi:hypothetical protein AYM40_16440 [Paraburkholderia phytofirmans OLGA172]|uniref:Pili assembly chaperone N-terminal domain-containing protein n=1 Tax=Paraburkholderia phytofirmans OLGA172 TaxID=1417228 RepID=A0A160FMB4_9BURK|nr:hypothetical protein [Paraburkholderia phytofirmans]ANB73769.1 hypothetical protein AYM40_16440 [Paraburkholderia phytofirmans OLGA172]